MMIRLSKVVFTSNLHDPAMSTGWERREFTSDKYDIVFNDGIVTVTSKESGRSVQSNISCHFCAEASVPAKGKK